MHLKVYNCTLLCVLYFMLITQVKTAVSPDDEHDEDQYLLSRQKRSSSNYDLVASHTVCEEKSADAVETGVSDAEKQSIVDMHNLLRSAADPPAANMLKMKWDTEVAVIAQKWAEHCDLSHDNNKARSIPGRFSVGQNLAMGARDFNQAMELWQAENETFVYDGENELLKVGHYTQINWADTNLIGCGYAKCGTKNYHVCNYATAGNVQGMLSTPYKSGVPCSDCPGHCVDSKLCECSVTCWNGGVLNVTSCTCDCLNSKYVGAACKLDCDVSDPNSGGYNCEGSFGQDNKCPAIQKYCPAKCGFCPAADYRIVEKAVASCLSDNGNAASDILPSVILVLFSATVVLYV